MRGLTTRQASPRRRVDLLVLCARNTPGHRRTEGELLDALTALGVDYATASTDYGLAGRINVSQTLLDFTQAASLSLAVARAERAVVPRAVIYPTSGAALLEPTKRLRHAAIRFDALTTENRKGAHNGIQHALERRTLANARVLLPFALRAGRPDGALPRAGEVVALPTPVEPHGPVVDRRRRAVLCYAGNPHKKGLDTIVRAWASASAPTGAQLLIAGIDAGAGRRFLRRRSIDEPRGLLWCGRVSADRYRDLLREVEVYLAASRFEDYGIAQLEALAEGAVLVTAPSDGPFEALGLARDLNERLVAADCTSEALARALGAAFALPDDERRMYRRRARELLGPYSRDAFRERLRIEVLPALLDRALV